jgi:uncharacterized protein YbjT (DUF2867 family)
MGLPKILVTRATGKPGAAIVAALRMRAVPVRALDRRLEAREAKLASIVQMGQGRSRLHGLGLAAGGR